MGILQVENLSVEYETKDQIIKAVNDVSFEVKDDETFGLVGESGCGKSTVAKSILRILPENGKVTEGSIKLVKPDIDIATASNSDLRDVRWNDISLIAQSSMNALDPVYTIGDQINEAFKQHKDMSQKSMTKRNEQLFEMVGLDKEHLDSYPHQLSGGMRQRAMIAMALALEPSLVIADEPTTALDVITQDHILKEIIDVRKRLESSMIMITHDISVVAESCDRVGVMYGGQLVESGPVEKVFTDPEHPYTWGLLNAFPTIEGEKKSLITMTGSPPNLSAPPTGCNFYDRCPYRKDICKHSDPDYTNHGNNHQAACFVTEEGREIKDEYNQIIEEGELWQRV